MQLVQLVRQLALEAIHISATPLLIVRVSAGLPYRWEQKAEVRALHPRGAQAAELAEHPQVVSAQQFAPAEREESRVFQEVPAAAAVVLRARTEQEGPVATAAPAEVRSNQAAAAAVMAAELPALLVSTALAVQGETIRSAAVVALEALQLVPLPALQGPAVAAAVAAQGVATLRLAAWVAQGARVLNGMRRTAPVAAAAQEAHPTLAPVARAVLRVATAAAAVVAGAFTRPEVWAAGLVAPGRRG